MRSGLTIIAMTGAAAAIASCGGAPANNVQKAATPTSLTPGRYEVVAELATIRSTDEATPRLGAQVGARTTRSICVLGTSAPADLFADEGDSCEEGSSYTVRNGIVSVTMQCTHAGWTGNLLYGAEGSFEAESFQVDRRLTTQLSGEGDFQSTSRLTGRRVGDCEGPAVGNGSAPAGNATAPAGNVSAPAR